MRKNLILKLVALGFTLALVPFVGGCSEDSATAPEPVIQDTAPPAPPLWLEAQRRPSGTKLTWSPNLESDLAGYNVWIYNPSPNAVQAYTKLNADLLTANEFSSSKLPDTGVDQYFRLTAVDEYGNESAFSNAMKAQIPYIITR